MGKKLLLVGFSSKEKKLLNHLKPGEGNNSGSLGMIGIEKKLIDGNEYWLCPSPKNKKLYESMSRTFDFVISLDKSVLVEEVEKKISSYYELNMVIHPKKDLSMFNSAVLAFKQESKINEDFGVELSNICVGTR